MAATCRCREAVTSACGQYWIDLSTPVESAAGNPLPAGGHTVIPLRILPALLLAVLLAAAPLRGADAQVAPTENPDQLSMLKDSNPALARNKKFVFDFWRIVYEGRHLEQAPKYMDVGYLQHNPNVPSGRAAFVALFSKKGQPL